MELFNYKLLWDSSVCISPNLPPKTHCVYPIHFNSFIPEFLKWTLPSLNLELSTDVNVGFSVKSKIKKPNNVDPDETAHYEPSQLDLHCFHRCLFWSAGLKRLKIKKKKKKKKKWREQTGKES